MALLGNLLGTVDGLLGSATGTLSGSASAGGGAAAGASATDTSHTLDLGAVIETGSTKPFAGEPRPIAGAGRERYVYAPRPGRFNTDRAIGECVSARDHVASLDGEPIIAPLKGALRGLSARGARIAVGQKVVEIDPRSDPALCFGLGERPRRIARGVVEALLRRRLLAGSASRGVQRESLHE